MGGEGNAPAHLLMVGLAVAVSLGLIAAYAPALTALGVLDAVTPTPDRLATPVMPESPTQVDIGRNLYYYHCMPCHGDRGQGLTDEWRQAWVEDHQDCWARGCHSGRADWALTAFVLHENGRLPTDGHVGPGVERRPRTDIGILIAVILGLLSIVGFTYRRRRKESRV